jgi:hypothetical protein
MGFFVIRIEYALDVTVHGRRPRWPLAAVAILIAT